MALHFRPNYKAEGERARRQQLAQNIDKAADFFSGAFKDKEFKEKQAAALRGQGLPEDFSYLPEQVQQAFAKREFAEGTKPETPAEKARRLTQEALAKKYEAQTRFYEQENEMAQNLMGFDGQRQKGFYLQSSGNQKPQSFDLSTGKYNESGQELSQESVSEVPNDSSTWTDQRIDEYRKHKASKNPVLARAAQMAENEYEKRESDKKIQRKEKEQTDKVIESRRSAALQETLPIRKEYADKAKYARNLIQNKKSAMHLLKNGKVDDPVKVYLSSFLPEAIANKILSADTQVYKAGLFEDFGAVRQMFSGATRVKELDLLEDKLATLDKSPEAKKKIIAAAINRAERDIILAKAAREVEKENPDATVLDFEEKVMEKAQPEIDKLFDKLLNDYEEIYFEHAPKESTFVDQNGDVYKNVPKNKLKELFAEAKNNGIELRIK